MYIEVSDAMKCPATKHLRLSWDLCGSLDSPEGEEPILRGISWWMPQGDYQSSASELKVILKSENFMFMNNLQRYPSLHHTRQSVMCLCFHNVMCINIYFQGI